MLCPFRKITINKSSVILNDPHTKTTVEFDNCYGNKCMAYLGGSCKLIKYQLRE